MERLFLSSRWWGRRPTRTAPKGSEQEEAEKIVGTSTEGIEDAIDHALARARKTLRNLDWFEVVEIRGRLLDRSVEHYLVTLKLGFKMEE